MRKLSTGDDSTLGNWRRLAAAMMGADSGAVEFLDEKIAKQSADEEVIVDEQQMMYLLINLNSQASRRKTGSLPVYETEEVKDGQNLQGNL